MGFLKSESKGKAPVEAPPKYSYAQFLATGGAPSAAAANTAAHYSGKAAASASMQAQLESRKPSSRRGDFGPRKSRRCGPGRVWMHILTVLQIAVAIGLIALVASCLNRQTEVAVAEGQPPQTVSVCYATTRSVDICWYSYWAAAASIAVSVTISMLNFCCPRRTIVICLSVEALLGFIGAAWWTGSAIAGMCLLTSSCSDHQKRYLFRCNPLFCLFLVHCRARACEPSQFGWLTLLNMSYSQLDIVLGQCSALCAFLRQQRHWVLRCLLWMRRRR